MTNLADCVVKDFEGRDVRFWPVADAPAGESSAPGAASIGVAVNMAIRDTDAGQRAPSTAKYFVVIVTAASS